MRRKAIKKYRLSDVIPRTKATVFPAWDTAQGPPPRFIRPQSLIKQSIVRKNQISRYGFLWWKPFIVLLCVALLGTLTLYAVSNLIQSSKSQLLLGVQNTFYTNSSSMKLPALSFQADATVMHTVSRGESFGSIVSYYGFPSNVADKIYNALSSIEGGRGKDLQVLHIGQLIQFKIDKSLNLTSLDFKFSDTSRVILKQSKEGEFSGNVVKLPQIERERLAVGIIKSSFAESATKIGVSYQTINNLVDLFSDRVEFNQDFRVGDRYSVIYQNKLLDDGTPVEDGPILAAALRVKGKTLYAVRYVGADGKERFFNGKGQAIGQGFLRYPVEFTRISSYFSYARFHPVLRIKRPHNGIDFAAPIGTPVRAVSSGKVVFAGAGGASGNMIKIKHNDRYATAYLHLSKIAKTVREGRSVERGQVIGAVGATGLATGPHLHFSFYDNGRYVDPLKIQLPSIDNLPHGAKIDQRYLTRVLNTLQRYQTISLEAFGWN